MKLMENSFQASQKEIFLAAQEAFFFFFWNIYLFISLVSFLFDDLFRVNICFCDLVCRSETDEGPTEPK